MSFPFFLNLSWNQRVPVEQPQGHSLQHLAHASWMMASLLSGNVSNQLVGVFLDSLLSRPYLAGFRVLGSRGGVGNLIVVVITTFVILFQLKRSPSSLHVHLPHSRFGNPLIISPKHDLNLVSNQIYIEERINAHKSHLY